MKTYYIITVIIKFFHSIIKMRRIFRNGATLCRKPKVGLIEGRDLPVAEWIWSSSPISDSRRKVLYGDAVISCRKAVISGGPRQVLPRRAAIPAVDLTSVFSTSAFVPARSTTRRPRASHFICPEPILVR